MLINSVSHMLIGYDTYIVNLYHCYRFICMQCRLYMILILTLHRDLFGLYIKVVILFRRILHWWLQVMLDLAYS